MKPDWDKLSAEFKDSSNVQIVDVDCTVEEKLCSKVGVSGYPTIKYYLADEPNKPKDYQGGRDLKSLKKFVEDTFKAACDVDTKNNCNDEQSKIIDELTGKGIEDVRKFVKEREDEIKVQKEARWAFVEESKKKIKEFKKIESKAALHEQIATKMLDKLEPTKKEEEPKEDAEKEEL